jgi:hypothetical protein
VQVLKTKQPAARSRKLAAGRWQLEANRWWLVARKWSPKEKAPPKRGFFFFYSISSEYQF